LTQEVKTKVRILLTVCL